MHRKISKIEKEIYEMIEDYIINNGYPPSYREIGNTMGMSVSTVYYHICQLKMAGLIQTGGYRSAQRNLRLASIKIEKQELESAIC